MYSATIRDFLCENPSKFLDYSKTGPKLWCFRVGSTIARIVGQKNLWIRGKFAVLAREFEQLKQTDFCGNGPARKISLYGSSWIFQISGSCFLDIVFRSRSNFSNWAPMNGPTASSSAFLNRSYTSLAIPLGRAGNESQGKSEPPSFRRCAIALFTGRGRVLRDRL